VARLLLLLTLTTLFAAIACSSSTAPPIVPGGAHTEVAGGGSTGRDAGVDVAAVAVVSPDGGGPSQTLTCTYVLAGTTGVVCAVLVGVPITSADAGASDCVSATYDGTPGTTCSPDSLVGCCELPGGTNTSFGNPTALCYYPGDEGSQTSCQQQGGTWLATPP
jgi:hypothetical protein